MKYVYQDSVELPVQQDFIEDIKAFLSICQQVIPLENRAIEINEKLKDVESALGQTTRTLKQFEENAIKSIITYAESGGNAYLDSCKDNIIGTIKTSVAFQTNEITARFEADNHQLIDERTQLEYEIKQLLNPYLADAAYNAGKTTKFKTVGAAFEGTITASLESMSFAYSLKMGDVPNVSQLFGKLELPIWKKAGIMKKEPSMKMMDISDFIISGAEFTDELSMVSIQSKKGNKKAQILRKYPDAITVWCEDEERIEITKDDRLVNELKSDAVKGFVEKARSYLLKDSSIKLKVLDKLDYASADAIHKNRVVDCLTIIATIYGNIVHECIKRGHATNEIIIKEIDESGERTEKYISVSEIQNALVKLGNKGRKLCETIGIEAPE